MMMGPEPMMRIFEMSVRLGIRLIIFRAVIPSEAEGPCVSAAEDALPFTGKRKVPPLRN
jgi:hypothetical protein